jgi:TolA-binding protein
MKQAAWLLVIASIGAIGYWFWTWRRRWAERERAAEERMAALVAQANPAAAAPPPAKAPSPNPGLLFDAAAKTAAAGESALSIQLYARLIARYPDSPFAAQARAAVEVEKKKLIKT